MMKLLYLAHAFQCDVFANIDSIRAIAMNVVSAKQLPIAPQIYLPQFIDERTERELAMACCLKLVSLCDEVRVYGEPSVGVQLEIAEAKLRGIPIVRVESG